MKKEECKTQTILIRRIAFVIIAIILVQILFPTIGKLNLVPFNYAADFTEGNFRYTVNWGYATVEIIDKSVTKIEIPDKIKHNGNTYGVDRLATSLSDLKNLKYITIPKKIVEIYTFFNASSIEEIKYTGVGTLEEQYLSSCKNLKRVRLSSGITKIADEAFKDIKSLEVVHAPSTLKKIGANAFSGCSNLKYFFVSSPNSIETIGNNAFYGCEKLDANIIDKNIKKIGSYAFYKTHIQRLSIPKEAGTVEIGDNAFAYSRLGSVEIKCNLSEIKDGTFFNCTSLDSVTLPNSLKKIGTSAFFNCGDDDKGKGDYIYKWNIPSSVTTIGDCAFWNCKKIDIQIPSSVTSIGGMAFTSISGKIYCEEGSKAQEYLKNNNIKYYTIAKSVNNSKSNSDVYVVDNNEYYLDGSNAILKKYKNAGVIYTVPSQIKVNNKTYNVTEIGSGSFQNTGVHCVFIPDTVKTIGTCAFENCKSLYRVDIPKSVTVIGVNIFSGIKDNVKIRCVKGSYAETYAKVNKISYEYIGNASTNNDNKNSNNNSNNNNGKNNYVSVDRTSPTVQNLKFNPQSGASKTVTVSWTAKDSGVGVVGWKISNKKDDWTGNYTYYKTRYSSVSESKTFTKNGTYYLYIIDANENAVYYPLNIRSIDTECPTISNLTFNPSGSYSRAVTVNWTAKDSGVGVRYWKISEKANDWNENYTKYNKCYSSVSGQYKITENGTYYLYIKDDNGNARYQSFTIKSIDTTKASITSLSVENKGNNAIISYSAKDNMSGVRYWKLSTKSDGSDGKYTRYTYNGKEADLVTVGKRSITVNKSGTYYLVLKDAAGNKTISKAITIKVDDVKPYITKLSTISNTGITKNGVYYLKNGSKLTLRATFSEDVKTVNKSKIVSSGANVELQKVNSKNYNIIITGSSMISADVKLSIKEGFLTDNAGNQSVASNVASKIKIVVDNFAPYVKAVHEGDKITAKITDASEIAKYQWKVVDENGKALWEGQEVKNVNATSIDKTLNLNGYKGKIVTLYVEDVLGNKKTYTIKPQVETKINVQLVSKNGNTMTYRITTNVKAKIYEEYKNYLLNDSGTKYCKVKSLKAEDSSGKKFLITVECTAKVTETIIIDRGTIYVENPHSSNEKEIKIVVDNTK